MLPRAQGVADSHIQVIRVEGIAWRRVAKRRNWDRQIVAQATSRNCARSCRQGQSSTRQQFAPCRTSVATVGCRRQHRNLVGPSFGRIIQVETQAWLTWVSGAFARSPSRRRSPGLVVDSRLATLEWQLETRLLADII